MRVTTNIETIGLPDPRITPRWLKQAAIWSETTNAVRRHIKLDIRAA